VKTYPKNIPASIHARLANEARRLQKPFGDILQHYGMERFLYRLFKTKYADDFILKGGLIFTVWEIPLRRPTKDIDFLGSFDNRKETMLEALKAAIAVEVPEDGVEFDVNTIMIEEKQVDADRFGIHASFLGSLGRAEIPMQIDIGFSDEITSPTKEIRYPTLLSDMDAPILRGYPPEAVVAEKFHAMEKFSASPSRWKDYYDVWLISEFFELDSQSLHKAIDTTFRNRNTRIPDKTPASLTAEFAFAHKDGWKRFVRKTSLETSNVEDLTLMVEKIWQFLECPLSISVTAGIPQKRKTWCPREREWA
jgi:predicted nucleotidyltransferase component of viral defense system